MQTYKIHELNVSKLNKYVASIKRKCEKYNFPFTFKEVGEEYIEEASTKQIHRFILFEVEGKVKLDGWEFVALITHTAAGNVISKANYDVEIPEIYRNRNYCDHCNSNRNRKETILLRNESTGEFKQVGKQCVNEYIGIDAEQYASMLSVFVTLENLDSEIVTYGSTSPSYIHVLDTVARAVQIIREFGYVSKNTAMEHPGLETTGSRVCTAEEYGFVWRGNIKVGCERLTQADYDEAQKLIDWVKAVNIDDEYYRNLKVIVANDYTLPKFRNLLVSIAPAKKRYEDNLARKVAETAQKKLSNYVGAVGERVSFNLKVVGEPNAFESDFGMTYLWQFVDNQNNKFIWYSSRGFKMSDGDEITLKGTIKEHKEYRDEKQTVLTRCKIEGMN